MPLFGGNKSWSSQASKPGGMFHPEKRCPPIDDCNVTNFVVAGKRVKVRNAKHLKRLQREQAAIAEKQKKERAAAARKNSGGGWPFAGKYDPNKCKSRGR